jgi:hypothetical protein
MTTRQPKGTPVGGQFAEGRKPEGGDLSVTGENDANMELAERLNRLDCMMQDLEEFGASVLDGEMSFIHATLTDARTALAEPGATFEGRYKDTLPDVNQEDGVFTLGDHTYEFEKTGPENDITEYTLTNAEGGGGWRFGYDRLTRRVTAHGVAPVRPSAEWRDKGEADIRTVARLFEPDARLIQLDGETYLIGGNPWPLSPSHLQGIATGEMMLNSGKTEHDLRAYVSQQRSDTARSETERPDMAKSFAETRSYIDGIEIAINLGEEAAKANTVGAMDARFKEKS